MRLLPGFKRKDFFSSEEKGRIVNAIRHAELQTSGEIRLYIESRCRFVDPLDRAAEIFWALKMDLTDSRNSVLLYVAAKDHQFAIFADQGIHDKLGDKFWENEVKALSSHFSKNDYLDAIEKVIHDIGIDLSTKFPYDGTTDKNELPDDIVFGK
ncbi:MAG: TPM domain-containing protein [Flavitalea sp.]